MSKFVDIIKYEGDNNTFIWKHPCEDFNDMTQLIVHESQEAIFFMDGQALDLFGPGRHTLETANIPKIGKLLNKTPHSQTPFHCEVYFINKTVQMAIKWGTDSKVRYIDPESGVPLELGASGELNMQVEDSRKLLVKLVGTTKGISWNDNNEAFTQSIRNCFRPMISMAVKSKLTTAIKEKNINILEVDEHLEEISALLRQKILPDFEEYGLTVPNFYLSTVVLPEDDPNFRKIRELYTISLRQRMIQAEAAIKTTQAQAEAEVGTAEAQAAAEIAAAQRAAVLERETTQTEVARREAERRIIEAQSEAEAMKAAGFAEAEVMRAKGYTEKDIIQADVQKAFAEGMGNMGGNGGAGGSAMSDIVGLGIGLQAANAMSGQLGGMFAGFGMNQPTQPAQQTAASTACAKCGAALPENAKFCFECGEKVVSADMIVCPNCGQTVAKGKFCLECGFKFASNCPNCGNEVQAGAKFCLECGQKL